MCRPDACKICGSDSLTVFAHTATCERCGILLCYPYHHTNATIASDGKKLSTQELQRGRLEWHLNSGSRNHDNFTNAVKFTLSEAERRRPIKALDYGGGGGQFALVLRSLYPLAENYYVDIDDRRLLPHFRAYTNQIYFKEFADDDTKFDVIFMNDVLEHVDDPVDVLKQLSSKLKDPASKIYVDTPCQFWLYPLTKILDKRLHTKVLKGTVDRDHQQIWSTKSFYKAAHQARLEVSKYRRTSEFTQGPDFYLDNMGIRSPVLRLTGRLFYRFAPILAANKVLSVLTPASHYGAVSGGYEQNRA